MADYFFRYFIFLFLIITGRLGVEGTNDECKITKCQENGPLIRFPFRLKPNQPKRCGYPGFELFCNHMNQTVLELPVSLEVVVEEIDYISQRIYVHDDESKDSTGAGSWSEDYADPIRVPIGPITRARARKMKEALMSMVQELMTKADAWRSIQGDEELEWKLMLSQEEVEPHV